MLKKSLLVVGALIICSVEGTSKSGFVSSQESTQNQKSNLTKMASSELFSKYKTLYADIYGVNGEGFKELKNDADTNGENLRTSMKDFREKLEGICDSEVADYSLGEDYREREISRLTSKKSNELRIPLTVFLGSLSSRLKTRRDSISWFSKWWQAGRDEYNKWNTYLEKSAKLKDLADDAGKFDELLTDCFAEAYDKKLLRGDETLQKWFETRRDYENGSRPRYFSQFLIDRHNGYTRELIPDILAEGHNNKAAEVTKWRIRCRAINEFSFPKERLNECRLKDEELMTYLSEGEGDRRLKQESRKQIIDAWKDSLKGNKGFRAFIPVVPFRTLNNFFSRSGGTARVITVDDLLICDNLDSLSATLWGTSFDKGGNRGLVLKTLQEETGPDDNRKSYLNATLIISNLERLCRASNQADYVIKIVEFFKFVTGLSSKIEPYNLPYLGVSDDAVNDEQNGQDRSGIVLDGLNVVLSTPTMSFKAIKDGVLAVWEAKINGEIDNDERFKGNRGAADIEKRQRIEGAKMTLDALEGRMSVMVPENGVENINVRNDTQKNSEIPASE